MSSRDTPFGLSFPRLRRGPLPLTGPRTATSLSLHHPPLRSLKALALKGTVSSLHFLNETADEKPAKASVVPHRLVRLLTVLILGVIRNSPSLKSLSKNRLRLFTQAILL